jgi:hypothetical protein
VINRNKNKHFRNIDDNQNWIESQLGNRMIGDIFLYTCLEKKIFISLLDENM